MQLLMLGTGGYHPNERRHTACLMLPEIGVILDAGSSFFRVPAHLLTTELDIFLTHAHLDHVQGLTYYVAPLMKGQVTKWRVHATPKTIEAVKNHLFSEPLFPVVPPFEFIPIEPTVLIADGACKVTHRQLFHPGGSIGFKLEIGERQIAYITDTTVDTSYLDFIRGVDVLIHECYFPDEMSEWATKTGHSHTSSVAQLAKDAGVGRLFLTHIDPQRADDDPIGLADARAIFPNTWIAEDQMVIDF